MSDDPETEAADRYHRLAAQCPQYFANPDADGIVILEGAERIAAERELARRMASRGQPEAWARAGLYYEDPWMWVVRDVVRFPDGGIGTYGRAIAKGGIYAAGVIPRFQGRLLLMRHFRHGIRAATLEFPRGGGEPGRAPDDLARVELREELGVEALTLQPLGWVHAINNLMMTRMYLFLADVDGPGRPAADEGIVEILALSPEDVMAMVEAGEITDATTVNLLAMARFKGLM